MPEPDGTGTNAIVERLHAAMAGGLSDADHLPVTLQLRPGLRAEESAALQNRYSVPLPGELLALLTETAGVEGLLDLDLTGTRHLVEMPDLLPAPHPIAADGFGNVWLLDLTPDTTEAAPVFFFSHDPPVLLYQAPDLATFVDEALKQFEPRHTSLVDSVRRDHGRHVWGSRPGAMSRSNAIASGDHALRQFAQRLEEGWTLVDLRQREIGGGLAWGRYGPRTQLARCGWERIFGYAPYVEPQPRWRRMFRRPGR